jgi:hypothetical protein
MTDLDPGLMDFLANSQAGLEDETPVWVPEVFGFERGYNQLADVIVQSADGADLNRMWREFQRSLVIFNRERDPLLNMITFDVTNPVERVMQPSTEDFEAASEFGVPKGVRIGKPFNLGYGFKWWDIAARYTFDFLLEADRQQIQAVNRTVIDAGRRLYFQQVFKRLFNNVNDTATINEQAVNVYALYNNDGTVPPTFETNTFLSTHNHYVTSGAATIDPGDLAQIEDDLNAHGYRYDLGYELILFVNRQEGSVIRTFVAGTASSRYTFLNNPNYVPGGIVLPQNGGIIGQPGMTLPQQIGTWGPFKIVEMSLIPAGYVLGTASGGEQNIGNLVGVRVHQRPEVQGLTLVQGPRQDYPLTDSYYRFGFGTGIRHRGAGYVMQITASGSYTIPTLYQ